VDSSDASPGMLISINEIPTVTTASLYSISTPVMLLLPLNPFVQVRPSVVVVWEVTVTLIGWSGTVTEICAGI